MMTIEQQINELRTAWARLSHIFSDISQQDMNGAIAGAFKVYSIALDKCIADLHVIQEEAKRKQV